ncbi:ras-GEF domain-containing family member 1B-A [Gadus morhua]|uniref:ras-GEF domain-containing family member 1B-A n=1 Tax=Gadus morhua TaxID=8049 RepID=UPI0011B7F5CB|nr:ras-GEF domain-containing family member 1B-A-like [Gadus morhua]XP_030213740.1 ras-GEF domain-containing family member 1B-A-like [Gadus morhua]
MPQTPPLSGLQGAGRVKRSQTTGDQDYPSHCYHTNQQDHPSLCYHDSQLVSGSLDALIQRLVPTLDYYPDRTYIFTFLLSSRLFVPPDQLMVTVCRLALEPRHDDSQVDQMRIAELAPKMVQLLREWASSFPHDFRDERLIGSLKDLTQHLATVDQVYRKALGQILQDVMQSLAVQSRYQEVLLRVRSATAECWRVMETKSRAQRDLLSVCNDPFTLAQQLTHIELERLSYIGPEEFIQALDQKRQLDSNQPSNLGAYVDWFNRLSYLVATDICTAVKRKTRARVTEFFIDVARECLNIGNFNSLMAILSGMTMGSVSRLKKTWGKVKTASFDILEHQMDPSSNFSNYRRSLQGALQRSLSATSPREKVVIPFFSLLIKDLYFLNQSSPSRLANGHVNFTKLQEVSRQLREVMRWQEVESPFQMNCRIQTFLLTTPVLNEDALYLASYESERPENNTEKHRWQTLRSSLLNRL